MKAFAWFAIGFSLVSSSVHAQEFMNLIGSSRLQCQPAFVRNHPQWAEAARLSASALKIICGDSVGTAVFVDTPSRRVVVTAQHIAVNYAVRNGAVVIEKINPPEKCKIEDPGTKRWIVVDRNIKPQLGHAIDTPNKEAPRDWMVLTLRSPITGATPLAIAEPWEFGTGMDLLLIGAIGWRGRNRQIDCKYMSSCRSRDVWLGKGFASYYYTDCSSASGQSGGPVLVKVDETYKVAAIFTAATVELPDRSPYDKEKMSSSVIAIDGPVREAIDASEGMVRSQVASQRASRTGN